LERLPDAAIPETLPAELRQHQLLIDRAKALRQIHFPADDVDMDTYERARSPAHLRLIFEDFFGSRLSDLETGQADPGAKRHRDQDFSRAKEICCCCFALQVNPRPTPCGRRDLQRHAVKGAMNRLLQGDVGSGKTLSP